MPPDGHEGLLPIDLHIEEGNRIFVVLARLPRENLREPFFVDSLAKRFGVADVNKEAIGEQTVLVRPLHYDPRDSRIVLLPLAEFVSRYAGQPVASDRLRFVFHMSRCGSTLAMQMLAEPDRFFVVSEPTLVNAVLDPGLEFPEGYSRMRVLQAAINALDAYAPAHCDHLFVKFRSWSTFFLDEITQAYPSIEWMFIHRQGIEVMESVLRDPPGWMRGREAYAEYFARMLGLEVETLCAMPDQEYAARLLGAFCRIAAEHSSERSLFVAYEQVSTALPELVEAAWNLRLTPSETKLMRERTRFHSKAEKGSKNFTSDSLEKRTAMGAEETASAERFIESERSALFQSHEA